MRGLWGVIEILLTNPYAVKQFQDLLVSVAQNLVQGLPCVAERRPTKLRIVERLVGRESDTTLFPETCPVKIESATIFTNPI